MLVELLLVLFGGLAVHLQHTHPALFRFYVDNSLPTAAAEPAFASLPAFLRAWAPTFGAHLLLWAATLGLAHLVLYALLPVLFHKYKLNREYPPLRLCCVEALRSVRGLAIAAALEVAIVEGYRADALPLVQIFGGDGGPLALGNPDPDADAANNDGLEIYIPTPASVPLLPIVLGGLLLSVVEETHFYWSHRMLHAVPFLYRHVHKDHHQSFNPDPLSGLSMHPLESAIYFSAAACVAAVAPQVWLARLAVKALVLTPLQGHSGMAPAAARHGRGQGGGGGGGGGVLDAVFDAGIDHYIHHAKFNYNYGGNPLWDILMGTRFPEDELRVFLERGGGRGGGKKRTTKTAVGGAEAEAEAREVEARKQAKLVGAKYD